MLKTGDSLLLANRDNSAAVIQAIKPSFDAFAESYRLASEKLLEETMGSKQSWDRTFQALPIVFLIRHYIELTLKALLAQSDKAFGTSRLESNLHHRLGDLWGETKQALNGMGINYDPGQVRIADELIAELAKFDPLSFSFRYPIDRKTGQPSLARVDCISLSNLNDVYSRFRDFLQGLLYEAYCQPAHDHGP
jgi:hypothetical protein